MKSWPHNNEELKDFHKFNKPLFTMEWFEYSNKCIWHISLRENSELSTKSLIMGQNKYFAIKLYLKNFKFIVIESSIFSSKKDWISFCIYIFLKFIKLVTGRNVSSFTKCNKLIQFLIRTKKWYNGKLFCDYFVFNNRRFINNCRFINNRRFIITISVNSRFYLYKWMREWRAE